MQKQNVGRGEVRTRDSRVPLAARRSRAMNLAICSLLSPRDVNGLGHRWGHAAILEYGTWQYAHYYRLMMLPAGVTPLRAIRVVTVVRAKGCKMKSWTRRDSNAGFSIAQFTNSDFSQSQISNHHPMVDLNRVPRVERFTTELRVLI